MNPIFGRWYCEQLVSILIGGAFFRTRRLNTELAWSRFTCLVAACDCWPCRVSWTEGELGWIEISSEPADSWDEDFGIDVPGSKK
jgi:hypothetical protein